MDIRRTNMRKIILALALSLALVSCASVPNASVPVETTYEEAVASAQKVVDWVNSCVDENNAFHNANINRWERAKADLLADEVYANYMKKQNRTVDTSEWDNKIAAEKQWLRDRHYTVNFEIVDSFKGHPERVGQCCGVLRGYEYTIQIKRDYLKWAKPTMVHEIAHFVEYSNGRQGHGKIFKEQAWNIGQFFFDMNEKELAHLKRDLERY